MFQDLTFLEEGKYTKLNQKIKELSEQIKYEDDPLDYISKSVRMFRPDYRNKKKYFRKRTAIEIIDSNFVTGCTDEALIYIAFARAAGIPTRYVETLLKIGEQNFAGHVFVDVFTDNKWQVRDPKIEPTLNNEYLQLGEECILLGKGLDFSEIYLWDGKEFSKEPVAIDSKKAIVKYAD